MGLDAFMRILESALIFSKATGIFAGTVAAGSVDSDVHRGDRETAPDLAARAARGQAARGCPTQPGAVAYPAVHQQV